MINYILHILHKQKANKLVKELDTLEKYTLTLKQLF